MLCVYNTAPIDNNTGIMVSVLSVYTCGPILATHSNVQGTRVLSTNFMSLMSNNLTQGLKDTYTP